MVIIFHLIDVWVPHLSEETEGRRRVRVVNGELDPSLEHKTDRSRSTFIE